MKVSYEATINDLVDNDNRLLGHSVPMKIWKSLILLEVFLLAGVLIYFLCPGDRMWKLGAGAAGGACAACLSLLAYDRLSARRLRKALVSQFGPAPVKVEVELTENALAVTYTGAIITYGWRNISSVLDTKDAVELLHRHQGITVVRNRAFAAPRDREKFITLARHFIRENEVSPGIII